MSVPIRNPAEVERMLNASPRYIAKKCGCTIAQADALQKYLLLVLVCDYRHKQGMAYEAIERQACLWATRIPPRLQDSMSRF